MGDDDSDEDGLTAKVGVGGGEGGRGRMVSLLR